MAYATAIFFLGAAVIHVSAAADHTNLSVMLAGFLCVAAAQAAFGALLLWRRPGRLLLLGGLALMLGSLATWLVSRTMGLPFLPGGHMEPIGFKDGVTVVFELATLPGLMLLCSRELGRVVLPSARIGSTTLAGVGAAVFTLFMPALVLGGGEHHSEAEHAAMAGHSHDGEELAAVDSHDQPHGGASPHGHADAAPAASAAGGHDHGSAAASDGDHAGGGHMPAADAPDGGHEGGSHVGGEQPSGGHVGDDHSPGGHDRGGHDPHRGGDQGAGDDQGGHEPGEQHGDGEDPHGADGHEEGHAGGGSGGGGEQDGMPGPDDPGGLWWGDERLDYEPARPASEGDPGSGYAFVWRGRPDANQGTVGHHSEEPCQATPEQQAAADRLYRETDRVMRGYDNNPARAAADGFTYAFPLTDRIIHMVNPARVRNRAILRADEIESFLYVMTDRGVTAVGGMYVMPEAGVPGPQIGGCITRWHEHAGLAGRLTTAGTMDRTPEMLHVWTYPGLAPYGHYDGRGLSQLWAPGSVIPSFCRENGDSSDACLP